MTEWQEENYNKNDIDNGDNQTAKAYWQLKYSGWYAHVLQGSLTLCSNSPMR